jgi:6-phosphogluconolactonase (cycloisomerase 2 family)
MNCPRTSISTLARKAIYDRGITAAIFLLVIALALPASLAAQTPTPTATPVPTPTPLGFVYVNNQDTVNTVEGFAISPKGALTPIPGSPFNTLGAGSSVTCYGLDRMVVNSTDKLLFVSNSADQTISVFQIDPTSGSLTMSPGSTVPTNLALDGCNGISLATTPDGTLLMASSGGSIQAYNVASTGALTPAALTTPSAPSTTVGMKISPDGKLLAISNESSISVYNISTDGTGTLTLNSALPRATNGFISGLEFSCSAGQLYANESQSSTGIAIAGWDLTQLPTAAAITGSPFQTAGNDSNVVALSPDNGMLYASGQLSNTIGSFTVNADGSLTASGSYIGTANTLHTPVGIAVDSTGNYLLAADDGFGIASFGIDQNGALKPVNDLEFGNPQEIQGVATYPQRSCASSDITLDPITATPATVITGSNVEFDFTVTNPGTTPASATVTYNLPAGLSLVSCTATGGVCSVNNTNPQTIIFPSIPAGASAPVAIVASSSTDLGNNVSLQFTALISNKGQVDPATANNTQSVTVTTSAVVGPSTLTLSPVTAPFGGTATITATLQKGGNQAVVTGRTVTFTFNGNAIGSAVTNGFGQATVTTSVAGLAPGSYPVTANFAGDSLYTASSASGTATVSGAVLTVTPANATMIYGSTPPAFTFTITGFLGTDNPSIVTGAAVCTTTATTASPVGNYPITCNVAGLAAPNYTFASGTGVLTVTPAPLAITVNNASRAYGAANPAFSGTITAGVVNGDTVNLTFGTSAQITSPVGNYVIAPLVSGNYMVGTVTGGVLSITPAPLTVTANNVTRSFGVANPPLTGTIVGLVNGDPITASYTTTATASSTVGVYPITPVFNDPGHKLGNYTVTIVNGTLTINPVNVTVVVNSLTRTYGAANPALTGTVTGLAPGDPNVTITYSTTATQASPVGSYPITANVTVNPAFTADYVVNVTNGTLTINPATLTVAINNASRVYGNANPTFKGTISGLVNGDSITATFSSVGPTSPVGTFPITPTFSDPANVLGNYTVVITGGVLTITPAQLTVAAVGGTRTFGAANPAITISGLKNGDNITATYTTPTASSAPGTYTLTPVLVDPNGLAGNYTVTIKTATLVITQAPLTITATNATVVLNSAAPVFTATYTGFVLGQGPADLTGTLNCTGTVTSVGSHPITCSGQTSTNYKITFVAGTASVQYAPVGNCTAGPGHQILAPISPDGSTVFTRASTATIPVAFRVCDANGASISSVSAGSMVSSFELLQRITAGKTSTINQPQATGFNFNTGTQAWSINLSTSTPTNLAVGSTYVYQLTLNDGTTINFQFSMN